VTKSQSRNLFYGLLLLTGALFAITATAYAVVPWLEQRAAEAGQPSPPSAFRDALRDEGWRWLLYQLIALVVFGLLSMGLDRLRSLKHDRQQRKMGTNTHEASLH
jgi:hypothetical protein